MATIVILPLPEIGHCAPVLYLAKRLEKRGHQVKILALPSIVDFLKPRHRDVVSLASLVGDDSDDMWLQRRRLVLSARDGRLQQLAADLAPDVVVADVIFGPLLLAFRAAGIPGVALSITLPDDIDSKCLSPWFYYFPRQGGISRLVSIFARAVLHLIAAGSRAKDFEGMVSTARYLVRQQKMGKHALRRPGFSVQYRIGVPELIACSQCFDSPRDAYPFRYFVGPCVETERKEDEIPNNLLDPTRPLVVCAFGSMTTRYRSLQTTLQNLMAVARKHDDWHWVVATGAVSRDVLGELPPNVVAQPIIPQWQLLQRACAFVTHGGLSSVKESILAGVPMLVLPVAFDQPGNAARVVEHGLGLKETMGKATPKQLECALTRLIGEPEFSTRVRLMRETFQEDNRAAYGVHLIEAIAGCQDQGTPL